MPASSPQLFFFDASTAGQLACPACLGDLRLEGTRLEGTRLVCAGCGRSYPVVDGIPVLIAERAEAGSGAAAS